MSDTEYTVGDLIKLSLDQKAVDFENTFGSIILDKIATAVDDRKLELAQSLFRDPDEEDTEEDAEESEFEQEEIEDDEAA